MNHFGVWSLGSRYPSSCRGRHDCVHRSEREMLTAKTLWSIWNDVCTPWASDELQLHFMMRVVTVTEVLKLLFLFQDLDAKKTWVHAS